MPKKKQRSPHGSVSILIVSKNLHLRWNYLGKRYRISLKLINTPINYKIAREKASEIERDIAAEQFDSTVKRFDSTLDKYKFKQIIPIELPKQKSTIALWGLWMEKQRDDGVAPQTLANRYQTVLNLLKHFNRNIETIQDSKDFQGFLHSRQSPGTANRNIKMVRTFFNWCVNQSTIESNPFTEIKLSKDSGTRSHNRTPFTHDEVERILNSFRLHPLYFRYHDFVLVLFTFGLRPSEAIGLQWKDIDLNKQTITISESLSRSGEGSRRIRKERKNGTVTVIDLPSQIHTMLQGRFTLETDPNDLIFTGPKGKPIDDHNFSQRVWRKILEQAGIPHRSPYNCRHSMASHAIDQGLTLPETAYLLGHKDTTMVSKVYGHIVNRPKVPKLGL